MKSRLRAEVLSYLSKAHPNPSYPHEIAKGLGTSRAHVVGALVGMNTRYAEDNSLVALELVEILREERYKYYKVTEKGLEVSKILNGSKFKS